MTKKQHFLEEHNRLSPVSMQTTLPLLTRFRLDKRSLFKDNEWSVDKLRRPFIMWLTSLSENQKREIAEEDRGES